MENNNFIYIGTIEIPNIYLEKEKYFVNSNNKKYRIYIFDDEGMIPHIHIYKDVKSTDKKYCICCIRIDCAAYYIHDKNTEKNKDFLNDNEKEILNKWFSGKNDINSKYSKNITRWKVICKSWNYEMFQKYDKTVKFPAEQPNYNDIKPISKNLPLNGTYTNKSDEVKKSLNMYNLIPIFENKKITQYLIIEYDEKASKDKLKKDGDKLWKTLSKDQKELAGGDSESYMNLSTYKYLIKRFKMIDKDTLNIIGIFDILKRLPKVKTNKDLSCQIIINPKYQNSGYGTILTEKATEWYKKNKDKYGDIDWACLRSNKLCIKLAEKCGWTYMDNISDKYWAVYNYK